MFDYSKCFAQLHRLAKEIDRGATEVLDTVAQSAALYASTLVNRRKPSGSLKDSIKWIPVSQTRAKVVAQKPYGGWVEYGRGPVHARPGGFLRFVINGAVFFRKSVGPAAARPFMRPARERAEHTAFQSAEAMVVVAMRKVGAL